MCRRVNNRKRYRDEEHGSISLYTINKTLDSCKVTNFEEIIIKKYHKFLPLFQEVNTNKLPPQRSYDYRIQLVDGFEHQFEPLYSLSPPEMEELKKWLKEKLVKGFKRALSTPFTLLILFVKKNNRSLWLSMHYRKLNEGTFQNCYLLIQIQDPRCNRVRPSSIPS